MSADEVEGLYGLPLERFTKERDELARRLRKEGRRDEAGAVKRLRRPSLAAWTVNRLARERQDEMRALLEAAERLRTAHAAGPDEFREAAAREREAVGRLVGEARALLAEAGKPVTDATLDAVARTLHAGAADQREREALEQGRLERELEASGFEALAGMAATTRPAPPREKGELRDREAAKRRVEEALAALAAARERARERRATADAAERAAEEARRREEREQRPAVPAKGAA